MGNEQLRLKAVQESVKCNHVILGCQVVACIAVVSVSFKPNGASVRGHWAKRSKKVGAGGGAGKERECLPLSPDILLNAVHQRTGGNDVLPLA